MWKTLLTILADFLCLDKVSMLEGDVVDIGLLCFSLASFDNLLTVFRQDNQG